ncbi:MAG: hypothetical protein IPF92_13000 [Myxococcales bacterium]|nr:hypothetical protein [Myxococcales bacterium]
MRKVASVVLFALSALAFFPVGPASPLEPAEKRGCCSRHQGVCGCSSGRTQCCDGTTSPTCQCRADGL